ncbi:uncharacterized protein LOC125369820 [Ricinus communis]|uniref:uncharacterized protein LOC125369820 n=1 Tax=Ricinus communis TaxID=3988 RepID=UPI00201A258C|nr:uncharacterized protein LOC125369820 [Ricinus communis]
MTLNEECSAILQNKLPIKRRDLGSFTISCLSEPKPTRISIQLLDRAVNFPRRIVENVLVKVDKFIFPIDFVVMDMEGESSVPLILGRPFLATSRAVIDMCDGNLQLRVGDETITFDLSTSMQHDNVVYSVDVLDNIVESQLHEILLDDPLQVALQAEDEEELSNEDVLEQLACCWLASPAGCAQEGRYDGGQE